MTNHPYRDSAPLGVKILAAVAFADGLQMVLGPPEALLVGVPGLVVFLLYTVVGLSELVTGVGLLLLEPYAYSAAMVTYTVGLVLDLLAGNVVGAVTSVVVVGYLYTQRDLFETTA